MRLLFKLRSVKNCEYDLKYFHKLQGFIYNLLKETWKGSCFPTSLLYLLS